MSARILIVACKDDLQAILEPSDSSGGFRTFRAASSRIALFQLGLFQPDLVLLDMTMPNGESWGTLERCRELSDVPVISFVDGDDHQNRIRSLEMGADFALSKPVASRELQARIRALLRRQQRPQPIPAQRATLPLG